MERLKLRLLAAKIELHWWHIRRARLKGDRLMKAGFSHSSQKFLALNQSYSKHCAQAMKAQRKYENATGILLHTQQMRA